AGLNRSTYQYTVKLRDDEPIRSRLKELAEQKKRYGAPLLTELIRREFGAVNHKHVERIYKEEGLQLPRKRRKGVKSMSASSPWSQPRDPMSAGALIS
ncbi:MAG: IS3 family transposase, partial [Deltaproteobacteria bacterium]